MTITSTPELFYFGIRGRAEGIRLLLEDAGQEYRDTRFTYPEWGVEKQTPDFLQKYMFGQGPRLNVNGKDMVQADAILRYLAEKCQKTCFTPNDAEDEKRWINEQLIGGVEDIHRGYTTHIYSGNDEKVKEWAVSQGIKLFSHFERFLINREKQTKFFLHESKLCIFEYGLLHLYQALLVLNPKAEEQLPQLTGWKDAVEARAGIKQYLASTRRPEMINGTPAGNQCVL